MYLYIIWVHGFIIWQIIYYCSFLVDKLLNSWLWILNSWTTISSIAFYQDCGCVIRSDWQNKWEPETHKSLISKCLLTLAEHPSLTLRNSFHTISQIFFLFFLSQKERKSGKKSYFWEFYQSFCVGKAADVYIVPATPTICLITHNITIQIWSDALKIMLWTD